jgi:hypothetical protein
MSDEVSALFPGCGGQKGPAERTAGSPIATASHFVVRLVICVGLALVPPACGVALAERFFAHSVEQAFLAIFTGWAVAGLSVWLFIRQGFKAQKKAPPSSRSESP